MRLIAAAALLALTAAAPDNNRLVISFAQGSATLSPLANAQLDLAAGLYKAAHPYVMYASGHTDKSGAEIPNLLLSVERGRVVKQGLVARGVPAERLLIQALAASDPLDDDGGSAQNRATVVTWRVKP